MLPVNIQESKLNPKVLELLLQDHSTNENIRWCTDNYLSEYGFKFDDQITVEAITKNNIIQPRAFKNSLIQKSRTKEKAEVFTPTWVIDKQLNSLETVNSLSWKEFVKAPILEITCGEAPYLTNRYDVTTGQTIYPLEKRIGVLDRKLQKVTEYCKSNKKAWVIWSLEALKSIYGYEWQGDSLLLARENIFISYLEYYKQIIGQNPTNKIIKYVVNIISWNIWQMDGLKLVVPNTDIKCKIMNWETKISEVFEV